jgi:hypothetical protein
MIDAILDMLFALINAVVDLLPDYIPSHTDAFTGMMGAISTINHYFPVDTLATCVSGYLGFAIMLSGVRIILKFAHVA